jgi:hypothetical protein
VDARWLELRLGLSTGLTIRLPPGRLDLRLPARRRFDLGRLARRRFYLRQVAPVRWLDLRLVRPRIMAWRLLGLRLLHGRPGRLDWLFRHVPSFGSNLCIQPAMGMRWTEERPLACLAGALQPPVLSEVSS